MNMLHLFFDWALAASLRAAALTAVTIAVQTALQSRLSSRWRYALWLPVLIVLIMPSFPQSSWSLETLLTSTAPPAPKIQIAAPAVLQAAAEQETFFMAEPVATPPPSFDWQNVWVLGWATGAAFLLAGGFLSYTLALRRFRSHASQADDALIAEVRRLADEVRLRRLPEILVSTQIRSPAVTGVGRSILMLPAGLGGHLSPQEAGLVLKHELMHLKRGDLPMNFLLCGLMALHWYNPLLWFAFFKARTDREAACDEQVLDQEPASQRHAYGNALLKIESAFCSHGLCIGFVGIFQRGSALRSRIQAIASPRTAPPATRAFIMAAIAAMIFLGVTRAQSPQKYESGAGFETGGSNFKNGDEIRIFLVDRNADRMIVKGAYELGSEDSATLSLDITSTTEKTPQASFDLRQHLMVQRGHGSFMLTFPEPHAGLPHVTFYKPSKSSESNRAFGGIYFGTHEEAEASKRLDLSYMTAGPVSTAKPAKVANMYLAQKMERIVIPQVQLKGATLEEAIEFLRVKARTLDTQESDPKRRGVNILLRKDAGTGALISLDLKNVPLIEALRYVTELAGVKFRVEPFAVLIEPLSSSRIMPAAATISPPKLTGRAAVAAQKIILPQVHFAGATLEEALEFIRVQLISKEDNRSETPNIVLKPGAASTARITIDLKDVPLIEALYYIAELSNHTLRSDDGAFILEPR